MILASSANLLPTLDKTGDNTSFGDGVYFVPLQPLTSIDLIVPTIADSLKLSLFSEPDHKTQLLDYLFQKRLLVVLDNFEHLMTGTDLLSEILENSPDVKIIVTSRERLRLQEEWVLDIHGLSIPEPNTDKVITSYPAVQLFFQCVRRAGYKPQDADDAAIVRICQLVEGNPLAIELSASWVRALTPYAIAQEIEASLDILATNVRNFPEQHRSMRSVYSHSLALCNAEEQSFFRRLAVFQGSFGREAAEQVTGVSLAILASLVDRSLLRVNPDGRYSFHELLRQFAAEQLSELSEEALQIRDRHCTYYASFMGAQWLRLTGSEIKAALTIIGLELNNVREAWDWAVKHRKATEIEAALRSLWFFYGVSMYSQEGVQVFANAVSAFSDNPAIYGKLMSRWGELEFVAGEFSKAHVLFQESLRLFRQLGLRDEIALVLFRLVLLSLISPKNVPEVTAYLEESIALYTELDDHFGLGEVFYASGEYYLKQYHEQPCVSALQCAQQSYQQSLTNFQQRESLFGIAAAHMGLALVAGLYKDYFHALQHIQASRKIYWNLGIGWGIVETLANEGLVAHKLGDYALARQCVLENLLFNLERGLGCNQYGTQFIVKTILDSLHLAAAILISEGKQNRAYEVLAIVNQQFLDFEIQPNLSTFFLLGLLDEELPVQLVEAVNRGRARDLASVIKDVIVDLSTMSSMEASASQPLDDLLSNREREIIKLITDGLNSREVAEQLFLSVTTVRWYLRQIYSKLDVHSRAELIARSKALHLII
jgi:predicted ATPase/DNA-binding CsgD family transcriptional regulator